MQELKMELLSTSPTLSRVKIPTSPLTNVTNTKLLCCQSTDSAGRACCLSWNCVPQYALQVDGSDYNASYDIVQYV